MIRAVAVAAREPFLSSLTGLAVGSLRVWVRPIGAQEAGAAAAVQDATLLSQALAAGASPLPVRGAAAYPDEAAVVADVEPMLPALVDAVSLVEGCVEVAVRIATGALPAGPALTGTDHLRQLLEERHRDEALYRSVAESFGAAARAVRQVGGSRAGEWRGAALVPREQLATVPERMAELDRRLGADAALSCSGPFPAYSFGPDQIGLRTAAPGALAGGR